MWTSGVLSGVVHRPNISTTVLLNLAAVPQTLIPAPTAGTSHYVTQITVTNVTGTADETITIKRTNLTVVRILRTNNTNPNLGKYISAFAHEIGDGQGLTAELLGASAAGVRVVIDYWTI